MISHDLDPAFEQQLRSMLNELAAQLDPTPPQAVPRRTSRRWMPAAAAAAVVAVGVWGVASVRSRPLVSDSATMPTSISGDHEAADSRITARLLYPGAFAEGSTPEVSVVGGSGAKIALLGTPSGRFHVVRVGEVGTTVLDEVVDRREIGGRTVVVEEGDDGNNYQWIDDCVLGLLQTTDPTLAPWIRDDRDLLDRIDVRNSDVTISLSSEWIVYNTGSANPIIQLHFDVLIDGVRHAVVLGQSIGGSIAGMPFPLSGPPLPIDGVPGRAAWIADRDTSPRLLFDNDGVAVGLWGTDMTVDDLITVAAQLVSRPDAWSQLLQNPAELAAVGTTPPASTRPDVCGTPTLTFR